MARRLVVVVLVMAPRVVFLLVGFAALAEIFVVAVRLVFPAVVVNDLAVIPGVIVAVIGIVVADVGLAASDEHRCSQGYCEQERREVIEWLAHFVPPGMSVGYATEICKRGNCGFWEGKSCRENGKGLMYAETRRVLAVARVLVLRRSWGLGRRRK